MPDRPVDPAHPNPGISLTTLPLSAQISLPLSAAIAFDPSAPRSPVRSLYIHIPFCVHKCHYCDFYSFVDTKDQQAAFITRLLAELTALAPHTHDRHRTPVPLHTIFIGGGTPSLLRLDLWSTLLSSLNQLFDISLIRARAPGTEFTVECNPESTTDELLRALLAGGVSRISVGAQSFHPHHLQTLQRLHNPDNVARALTLASNVGIPRTSLDLIYAIPNQTLAEWQADLTTALSLNTTHISCYNLTYEPTTAMTARLHAGEFAPTDEDLEADMFQLTSELLASRNLQRYEVSNYALPGHESQHNLAYWLQHQWLAAGPSASAHIHAAASPLLGSHRYKNRPTLAHYLDFSDRGYAPITNHESPDPKRLLQETAMTAVRLARGLDLNTFLPQLNHITPRSLEPFTREANELRSDGLLHPASTHPTTLAVTDRGWLLADLIARKLMAAI